MLAATRLIALHKNKGMTVAACLKNRTDYIENPDKTEQGQFVSSYACSALTADEEFMLTKRQYDLVNGRRQKSDVIAYQIRQSFRPGEITAEEANKVGYELAMRFTKGKYQKSSFFICPRVSARFLHTFCTPAGKPCFSLHCLHSAHREPNLDGLCITTTSML